MNPKKGYTQPPTGKWNTTVRLRSPWYPHSRAARDDPRRNPGAGALRPLFCQGGFRQIGVTFARLLLMIAAVKPGDL